MERDQKKEKLAEYLATDLCKVVDTIGVPHPYCITPKHIEVAKDFGAQITIPAIEAAEKKFGPCCGTKGCDLLFSEHEQALLVEVKTEDKKKIQEYCQSIAGKCESDGFAGFAFIRAKEMENENTER